MLLTLSRRPDYNKSSRNVFIVSDHQHLPFKYCSLSVDLARVGPMLHSTNTTAIAAAIGSIFRGGEAMV